MQLSPCVMVVANESSASSQAWKAIHNCIAGYLGLMPLFVNASTQPVVTAHSVDLGVSRQLLDTVSCLSTLTHLESVAGPLGAGRSMLHDSMQSTSSHGTTVPTWLLKQVTHSSRQALLLYLQHATDELDASTATLWFAGKQLLPKKLLSDHLGRHEKTKAVIKLQQAGQGAPVREPVRVNLNSVV